MKKTLKTLYHIEPKALIKYSDKVYKIKCDNDEEYCLKYVNTIANPQLNEKMETLNLTSSFVMPMRTCIRTSLAQKDQQLFYVLPWIEDDLIESKDLKIKYYLLQIGKMHQKSSYTLNVSSSFYHELCMQIEENIEECYQKYETLMYQYERKEYKSPFQWYFIDNFRYIIQSLDKSREYLNQFKTLVKDKSTIRQVITHQNFSYDHVFLAKDKIIGNDKMKMTSPVYEFKSLFSKIEFGEIDISGMFDEYLKSMSLEEYELKWMLSILYIVDELKITNNDFNNLSNLMNILFRYKSINELESKINKN